MAKWIRSSTLEFAATGAALVAATVVIVRSGRIATNDDSLSEIRPVEIGIGGSASLGDVKATEVAMVFSDFECSFCRVAADQLIPWLRSEYVDRGKLRLVLKHFPLDQLHSSARRLAWLSACASLQQNPWDVHALVYRTSPASSVNAEFLSRSFKLDARRLDQCSAGLGREIVQQDIEDGLKLGVSGTPTFVLGTVRNDVIEARFRLSGVVAQAALAKAIRRLPSHR